MLFCLIKKHKVPYAVIKSLLNFTAPLRSFPLLIFADKTQRTFKGLILNGSASRLTTHCLAPSAQLWNFSWFFFPLFSLCLPLSPRVHPYPQVLRNLYVKMYMRNLGSQFENSPPHPGTLFIEKRFVWNFYPEPFRFFHLSLFASLKFESILKINCFARSFFHICSCHFLFYVQKYYNFFKKLYALHINLSFG